MSCSPPVRTLTLAVDVPVWSTGDTNPGESDIFVLSREDLVQIAPMIAQVRVTMTVANATVSFQCRPVFQATNDAVTWDQAINLDTDKAGNGSWTSTWYSTAANFKRGIRFGVIASAASGTAVQVGRVTLVLDIQLKS